METFQEISVVVGFLYHQGLQPTLSGLQRLRRVLRARGVPEEVRQAPDAALGPEERHSVGLGLLLQGLRCCKRGGKLLHDPLAAACAVDGRVVPERAEVTESARACSCFPS